MDAKSTAAPPSSLQEKWRELPEGEHRPRVAHVLKDVPRPVLQEQQQPRSEHTKLSVQTSSSATSSSYGNTAPPEELYSIPSTHIQHNAEDITLMGLRPGSTWEMQTAEFQETRTKHPGAKRILFVRHGEGIHNEAERRLGKERWETHEAKQPAYFDPPLNEVGVEQSKRLGAALRPALENQHLEVDLLIVSPLVRAIETAQIAFSSVWHVSPIAAVEMARERHGKNTCDARRPVSELQAAYPDVDFELFMEGEHDTWHDAEVRETPEHVRSRVELLLHWILGLPDTVNTVAVVGHSDYMSHAVEAARCDPHWPSNCEVVPLIVVRKQLQQ